MRKSIANFKESLRFEYWPVGLVYLPALFYWLILAFRSRAMLYMTAANPGIEMGGFFGESKKAILDLVPDALKPQTILFQSGDRHISHKLQLAGISFPVVAKPNVGERGNGVEKLNDLNSLEAFLSDKNEPYLIQEYSSYPLEYGVLFYRMPGEEKGKVLSITGKKFMSLVGDGKSSMCQLMEKDFRFRKQIERLAAHINLEIIPDLNEVVHPEPIGNHCRGTEFTNENHLISEQVHALFSQIAGQMEGFYIGRFDLKAKNENALLSGDGLHILEVNGTTSEPGHIYSRGYGILNAYRSIFEMMKKVQEIGVANHKRGTAYTSLSEFLLTLNQHFFRKNKPKTKLDVVSEPIYSQPVH